ncbi:hypothetical protein COW81_02790 [Candidatus Campbellbacteria bacterium CG22_combo_CG10-13_8_21_14_all_36_13]|uniref:HTH arsR-type domain-containing protein n=1 Tax=Candidatus Campbellbacteria bacterium CG22_combo_CG10-13_8_21_14_all_36_13 TaxID=1974529 RepID=A0A2H0DYL6_9BACT|nr:MAG: hypothetical protein COW81_02790 [Candidatus Campbellbacteria bacterium CG22_combo_CG10-13_8_21_14_all_36_13]
MKQWSIIFKTLSNINRLKIIEILSAEKELSVTAISNKLNISFTATSNHLIILKDLDVLNNRGKDGNVFYSINKNMPRNFYRIIKLLI